jgi:hypothetical protein
MRSRAACSCRAAADIISAKVFELTRIWRKRAPFSHTSSM